MNKYLWNYTNLLYQISLSLHDEKTEEVLLKKIPVSNDNYVRVEFNTEDFELSENYRNKFINKILERDFNKVNDSDVFFFKKLNNKKILYLQIDYQSNYGCPGRCYIDFKVSGPYENKQKLNFKSIPVKKRQEYFNKVTEEYNSILKL